MNVHIIRASDGFHLVGKVDATLTDTYVDIRAFRPSDWARHPELAMALWNADRKDLIDSAASDAVKNAIELFR